MYIDSKCIDSAESWTAQGIYVPSLGQNNDMSKSTLCFDQPFMTVNPNLDT